MCVYIADSPILSASNMFLQVEAAVPGGSSPGIVRGDGSGGLGGRRGCCGVHAARSSRESVSCGRGGCRDLAPAVCGMPHAVWVERDGTGGCSRGLEPGDRPGRRVRGDPVDDAVAVASTRRVRVARAFRAVGGGVATLHPRSVACRMRCGWSAMVPSAVPGARALGCWVRVTSRLHFTSSFSLAS